MICKPLAWKGSQAPLLTKGLEVSDLISHLFFWNEFSFSTVFCPHFLLYAAKKLPQYFVLSFWLESGFLK